MTTEEIINEVSKSYIIDEQLLIVIKVILERLDTIEQKIDLLK